jgi:hypothetical protein
LQSCRLKKDEKILAQAFFPDNAPVAGKGFGLAVAANSAA